MFQKVLINDDHDAIIDNVSRILNANGALTIHKSQYCDEAYLKLKRSSLDNDDYDLIVTDLSFKRDHRNTDIASGEALIERIRRESSFPNSLIIL